jgi:hypothetical protein
MRTFTVVILEEIEETNLSRSAVRFEWDYVGALGGAGMFVYRDNGAHWWSDSTKSRDDYVNRIHAIGEDTPISVKAGFVGIDEAVVPIGDGFYAIEWIDDYHLLFRALKTVECDSLSIVRVDTTEIDIDESEAERRWGSQFDSAELLIPELDMRLESYTSWGATGRNYWIDVEIEDNTFYMVEHFEPDPYPVESSSPVFLKLERDIYLRIEIELWEDEKIKAYKCTVSRDWQEWG